MMTGKNRARIREQPSWDHKGKKWSQVLMSKSYWRAFCGAGAHAVAGGGRGMGETAFKVLGRAQSGVPKYDIVHCSTGSGDVDDGRWKPWDEQRGSHCAASGVRIQKAQAAKVRKPGGVVSRKRRPNRESRANHEQTREKTNDILDDRDLAESFGKKDQDALGAGGAEKVMIRI